MCTCEIGGQVCRSCKLASESRVDTLHELYKAREKAKLMCKYEMIGSTIEKDGYPIFDEDVLTELQSLQAQLTTALKNNEVLKKCFDGESDLADRWSALARERLEMLKKVRCIKDIDGVEFCAWCGSIKGRPHQTCSGDDCALDKLIKEREG